VDETVEFLTARVPKLRQAVREPVEAGDACIVVEGTLIAVDRVAPDRPFFCGRHREHGMNLHVIPASAEASPTCLAPCPDSSDRQRPACLTLFFPISTLAAQYTVTQLGLPWMKLVVYGPEARVAVQTTDGLFDAAGAAAAYSKACRAPVDLTVPARLVELIELGRPPLDLLEAVDAWVRAERPDLVLAASDVEFHAPWPGRRIAAAGGNFADHLSSGMARRGRSMTSEEACRIVRSDDPLGYWKLPSAAIGPDGVVPYPRRCDRLDYEGEVAIVIGTGGKDIAPEKAMSHVWGVTAFNDWSIRTPPKAGFFPFSLNLDKNFDGATSLGPAIVVDELDPSDLWVNVRVNSELRQAFSTNDMIYSFAEYVAYLSRDLTLLPGDMIVSGTGAGTVADSAEPGPDGSLPRDKFLQVGDVVEVEVAGIGVLRNTIGTAES
jgi:2-keto-4-pentenoate hydratase/2-oxohepta-3-ene-1,7-dioic acid hydratase in catechol pathway